MFTIFWHNKLQPEKCLQHTEKNQFFKVLKYHYNLKKKKKVTESSKVSFFRAQVGKVWAMGQV